jgi:hypothetical protein
MKRIILRLTLFAFVSALTLEAAPSSRTAVKSHAAMVKKQKNKRMAHHKQKKSHPPTRHGHL